MKNPRETPKMTNLKCPITGDYLLKEPLEMFVMDPTHYYFAEFHPEIRYGRHPFEWNIFRQVYNGDIRGASPLSIWRLDEGTWIELIKVDGLDELIQANTPAREIELLKKIQQLEQEIRNLKSEDQLYNGIVFPQIKRVESKTIASELVSVAPMPTPKFLNSMYFDVKIGEIKAIHEFPYVVTEENLEAVRKEWDLEKYEAFKKFGPIQVGDKVDKWEYGGPLSMRKGEMIIREKEIIYKKLTAMS